MAVSNEVLAAKLDGLKELTTEKFDKLGTDFDDFRKRTDKSIEDHEDRIVKLERIPWMVKIIWALLGPVTIWALIEIGEFLRQAFAQ